MSPSGKMGGSINVGIQNGWFIMENPMNMDDDWGYPYFRTPPYGDGVGTCLISWNFMGNTTNLYKAKLEIMTWDI